ncbi:MAG: CotH kinase family protein [Candidatus Hodarchaeota archaeon]
MPDSLEKLKPSRIKRELIPFIIISAITVSSFIYFSYQDITGSITYSPEVPSVNIEVSSEITNYSQQCFLKFSPISNEFVGSGWANRQLAANIRKRNSDGGFSFELFQNENLFLIRNDDDWFLLPQGKYLDSLRTKMAFDIFNMITDNNLNYRLPHSKLIDVFVNGNYKGLYLLCERIDRKMMNLEQENIYNPEENDMIFKATNWNGDFYNTPTSIDPLWEQMYPNILDFSHVSKYLTEFIHNASEEEFFNKENGVFTVFDKSSIIDNLLFGLLVGHEIIEGSSYYLILNQKSEVGFFFLPWNFAQSWGFYKDGRIPIELWLNRENHEITSIVWSKLYHRLLFPENSSINNKFISEIVNRWSYIRTNYWDSNDLILYFSELRIPIQTTLIRATSDNDFVADLVDTIENWIITRVNLIDDILNKPNTIFSDNFTSKYREDDEIFGFSNPTARRQYYKSSKLFSAHKIHEVSIVIQWDYFNDILIRKNDSNRWTERLYMPCDISIDNYSMDNVGFRIRGNYNNLYPKNSFKLKFSEPDLYVGGGSYKNFPDNEDRRFLGLKRLNLRAAPIDFSLMNEVAGYELYNILCYPCPRVSWAKLYLTKTDEKGNIIVPKVYIGLYLLTEDIDKTFVRFNFKSPEGNLYKTTDIMATLEDVGDLKDFLTWDGRRVYELRTNEELDDYSDLQKFVHYINYNWSNIHEVINLTLLAKYFAASNFQGNWDDYIFLPHNYFLYSDPNFGFVFLPWDIEQNLNIGTNLSIIGFNLPYSPDFRYAPLFSGYLGYFNFISYWAMISPYPRPLWDNLVNKSDLGFKDPYKNSHQKIVDNVNPLKEQLENWFDRIEPWIIEPYSFTDPVPNPQVALWYPEEVPLGWYLYDKARVLNFLEGRKQYVNQSIPLI